MFDPNEYDPFGVTTPTPETAPPPAPQALALRIASNLIPLDTLTAHVDALVAPGRDELTKLVAAWKQVPALQTDDDALRAEKALQVAAGLEASTDEALAEGREWFHVRHKIFTAAAATVKVAKKELDDLLRPKLGAFITRKRQAEAERERLNREAAEVDRKRRAQEAAQAAVEAGKSNLDAIQVAQEVLQQPLVLAPVTVAPGPATGTVATYEAVLTSKAQLLQFVVEKARSGDASYLDLVDLNQPKANALAKALGANMQIPGLEAREKIGVRVKKGK